MTVRQLRLLRASAASAVATLLAAVSHTVGGGAAPHPLLLLSVASLVTPVSALLIGSRPSRLRVAATIGVAQAAFHAVFHYLGAPTASAGGLGGVPHAHHRELPATVVAALPSPDAAMIAAHLVAAALTTLLVWHGESAVRTIARWVRAILRVPVPAPRAAHSAPRPLRSAVLVVTDDPHFSQAPRRGPPALLRG